MFSITEAAFAGLGVIRRNPVILAWWAGFQLLFAALSATILIGMGSGAALKSLQSVDQQNPDLTAMTDAYVRMAPGFLVLMAASVIYYGIFYSAANRAVLKPEAGQFGYLRLGGAEVLQGLQLMVQGIIFAFIYMALVLAGSLAMVIFSLGGTIGAIVGIALMVGIILGGLFAAGTKFSMASPRLFATGRFNPAGGWALTHRPYWRMLGAYALSTLVAVLSSLIILGLYAGAVFTAGGMTALMSMFQPDMTSFATFLQPITIGYYILSAVCTALYLVIWLSTPAYIYGRIGVVKTGEVFA